MATRVAPRAIAVALIAAGVVVCAVALAGAFGGWAAARTTAAAAAPRTTPTADTPAGTSPPPAGSTAAPPRGPAAAKFLADLGAALAAKNVGFLVGRLAPAVIDRYGAAQCRAHVAAIPATTFGVRKVRAAAPYRWRTDGLNTLVPDTRAVIVDYTQAGTTSTQTVHLALTGGRFGWFTDCGTPVH